MEFCFIFHPAKAFATFYNTGAAFANIIISILVKNFSLQFVMTFGANLAYDKSMLRIVIFKY